MLVNRAAAISAPQWYTSPRTSAIGTPRLTVILFTELMNVRAYTNSCSTSVKLNTTTVKIPGTISRGATFRITARRLYPSIIACSSISHGTERQLHVVERGRVVEDPRDVAQVRRAHVQIPVLLELRDEHPVKREPGEDHDAERRSV